MRLDSKSPEHQERIALVLQLRSEGKTLREIGAQIGVSRERVRQLEAYGLWWNRRVEKHETCQ